MECGYQGWREAGKPGGTWTWAVLGSLLMHGLLVAGMVMFYKAGPVRTRVVVPVEAIALVPMQPGPKGGGGGLPAPITQPQPVAPKPAPPVRPKPKPKVKTTPRRQVKPEPLPEPTKAPTIATPAPPPAITRAKSLATTSATCRTSAPAATAGVAGPGQGGSGGGRGTGSGGGVGPGQGRGSGAGSALQGYLREVRQLLEKQKNYPMMARRRNIQGVVVVLFTIAAGGQVESSRISCSSGHDLLDEAARDTIRRVGRFPPFPPDLNRPKLTIKIPLAFRLNQD